MKTFRKKLAVILAAAMLAGLTTVPSLAEETQKMGWFMEDGSWYFRKSDGELAKGRIKMVKDNWYAFDEEGRMYSDTLLTDPRQWSGAPDVDNVYAFPDGHLAVNSWVKLNEEGKQYNSEEDSEDSVRWCYFGKNPNNPDNDGWGEMLRGIEKKINNKTYAFREDGTMVTRDWVYIGEEDGTRVYEDYSEGLVPCYYQYEGEKAVDKWLPLEDSEGNINEYWYKFSPKGAVTDVVSVASPANADPVEIEGIDAAVYKDHGAAPGPTAESIAAVGETDMEVVPGEEVELKFKVKMASPGNADEYTQKTFKRSQHDIWIRTQKGSGSYKIKVNESGNGEVSCLYTPKLVGENEIYLYVDGVESDDSFSLSPKQEMTATEQKKAVTSVLDSWEDDGYRASQVKDNIGTVYNSGTEETRKELQNTLLSNNNYEKLASAYATEKGIDESAAVAEEAQKQLGGTVTLAGGALNVESDGGAIVKLNVDMAEAPELTQEFAHKIAFDLTLAVNDSELSELTIPVKITMPVPTGYDVNKLKLYHIHNGEESEVKFVKSGSNAISFMTDRFSTYVFSQNKELSKDDQEDDNQGGNGSSHGSSSSSSSGSTGRSSGVVTVDAKKGKVNSLTGIITGSGKGYSKWQPTQEKDGSTSWKLQYADGTAAAGAMITREDGTVYERLLWEMIDGKWFAFGADGYADSGFIYDADLDGYFYIDINTGMKTGWTQIDGKWYYLNPVSDGKRGVMRKDTWVDGWYLDKNGVWDGQTKKEV